MLFHQLLSLCPVRTGGDGRRDSLPAALLDVVDLALRFVSESAVCVHLRDLRRVADVVNAGER